ncbi:MAG: ArsR family transcriptional regulator, partial [Patescibacteria group bacterium]|nr:ArsR family transcriptional regulator [Patescibacteria group bacterium]
IISPMTRKNRLKAKVRPFAKHMAAIGDVSRLSILYILAHKPCDVREIIDITGIHPALLGHHLRVLRQTGWVSRVRFGKRAEYSIEPKAFFFLKNLFRGTMIEREVFNLQK